tara:strand:+ start:1333 stop:2019 length:687 start_codon:yes stop_codon:yes gene_type:complete
LNEEKGIQFGVNYTAIYLHSSATITDENTASTGSGILDIQGGITLIGKKAKKNEGKLFVKMNSRHTYGGSNKTAPMFHGLNESGYYVLPATGYRSYSFRMIELNWQQSLAKNKVHFVVGKVDPTNYFNFHGLIVPWQHFIGYGSSVSGTVNWPDQGLGFVGSYRPTEHLYVMGGITDVRGDLFEQGEFFNFGNNFDDGKFMKLLEVGYVPSFGERYFKKISITYWHSD